MNRKILFSLTMMTLLASTSVNAGFGGWGITLPVVKNHVTGCCDPAGPNCTPCPDGTRFGWMFSIWVDPAMTAATGLDWAAVKHQQKRSIDAKNAVAELESHLQGGDCNGGDEGETTSLTNQDAAPVVPDIVITEIQGDSVPFDSVRQAVGSYLFYADDCKDDCVLERQNTWLLTSIAMAAATGDKVLATAKDNRTDGGKTLNSEFESLINNFNKQESPMDAWAASSYISLHTHVQQNDINALYARDLEMNALNGVHEAEQTTIIE